MHKSQSLFNLTSYYHPSSGAQNNCNYSIW